MDPDVPSIRMVIMFMGSSKSFPESFRFDFFLSMSQTVYLMNETEYSHSDNGVVLFTVDLFVCVRASEEMWRVRCMYRFCCKETDLHRTVIKWQLSFHRFIRAHPAASIKHYI